MVRSMVRAAVRGIPLLVVLLAASRADAQAPGQWNPAAWAAQDTVTLGTTEPGEPTHWFPVWLAVIDGEAYVRLGTRAAARVEHNQGGDVIGVQIAGQQFDRVKIAPAPDKADAVARAMSDKYWSDVFVHLLQHPLTARLEPIRDRE